MFYTGYEDVYKAFSQYVIVVVALHSLTFEAESH